MEDFIVQCYVLVMSLQDGEMRLLPDAVNSHPFLLTQVKKQPDGKLTVVLNAKDGSKVEIADNDQVLMATGVSMCVEFLVACKVL